MESNLSEPLLAGTGKNPPTDECSGSGADNSKARRDSPRRSPPPPPPPPPPSLLGLGDAKNQVIFSSSPAPPSLSAHGIAKNQPASASSPLLPGMSDFDPEALPGLTTAPTSHREGLGNETSSSPSSRAWWDLFGRLRRRAPLHLPVSAPRGSGRFDAFREYVEELRHSGPRLDSVGVERVIGIFGFSLFGSISLFPYTMDRIKDFATINKSMVMFCFGLIWVLASVGVLSGLQGKSDFEQAFCRFTGRLGVFGLAVLVTCHVWWTLPSDNTYCTAGFYALLTLACLLHLVSGGMSFLVGEDRIEDKESPDAHD